MTKIYNVELNESNADYNRTINEYEFQTRTTIIESFKTKVEAEKYIKYLEKEVKENGYYDKENEAYYYGVFTDPPSTIVANTDGVLVNVSIKENNDD